MRSRTSVLGDHAGTAHGGLSEGAEIIGAGGRGCGRGGFNAALAAAGTPQFGLRTT